MFHLPVWGSEAAWWRQGASTLVLTMLLSMQGVCVAIDLVLTGTVAVASKKYRGY